MRNTRKGPLCYLWTMQAWSACAFGQADLGHRPLTESVDAEVYVDKQRMARSICTDGHAHLDLSCLHMA